MCHSFNRGDKWQPLQLNLPVASVRDTEVHGDDLIVATHGRSFWVLDDISPLRQAAAASAQSAYLFRPAQAMRIDNDTFNGTPLPPEEPAAKNPLEGAIIDYYLKSDAREVTLEILTSDHQLVRRFSSETKPRHGRPPQPIAERWFPKPQTLEATPGMHRFLWNMNWSASGDKDADDDDDNDYAPSPRGPSVIPGTYEVRLTVDGKVFTESLKIVMDPRTGATPADLALQLQTGKEIFLASLQSRKALAEINSVEEQIQTLKKQVPQSNSELNKDITDFDSSLRKLLGSRDENSDSKEWGLIVANSGLTTSLGVVEGGERTAPSQAMDIYKTARRSAEVKEQQWEKLKTTQLVELNKHLQAANVSPVAIAEIQEQVDYLMTR